MELLKACVSEGNCIVLSAKKIEETITPNFAILSTSIHNAIRDLCTALPEEAKDILKLFPKPRPYDDPTLNRWLWLTEILPSLSEDSRSEIPDLLQDFEDHYETADWREYYDNLLAKIKDWDQQLANHTTNTPRIINTPKQKIMLQLELSKILKEIEQIPEQSDIDVSQIGQLVQSLLQALKKEPVLKKKRSIKHFLAEQELDTQIQKIVRIAKQRALTQEIYGNLIELLKERKAGISEDEQSLIKVRHELAAREQELSEADKKIKKLESDLQQIRTDPEQVIQDLKYKLDKSYKKRQRSVERLKLKYQKNRELVEENRELVKKNQGWELEVKQQVERIKQLEAQITMLTQQITELRKQHETDQAEIAHLQQERDTLTQQITELTTMALAIFSAKDEQIYGLMQFSSLLVQHLSVLQQTIEEQKKRIDQLTRHWAFRITAVWQEYRFGIVFLVICLFIAIILLFIPLK